MVNGEDGSIVPKDKPFPLTYPSPIHHFSIHHSPDATFRLEDTMTTIAFIGLGNMGNPMAANLVKAGHTVFGFDLMPANLAVAKENGITVMASAPAAVKDADVVVTMLPAGKHVLSVYEEIAPGAKA